MLNTKSHCYRFIGFFKVFTIYGNGGILGHVTQLICINLFSHYSISFFFFFYLLRKSNYQDLNVVQRWKCHVTSKPCGSKILIKCR